MKAVFPNRALGIATSTVALCLFVLVYFGTLNADELPVGDRIVPASDKTPEDRLENLLTEMGYTGVDVNACVLQFRRDLPNQCPTDKSLSYWRSIDLRNLDMEGITGVQSRENDGQAWHYFTVPPTRNYYLRSIPINGFERKMKEKYLDTGWPFRFDETTPYIREEFYQEFPRTENMNWRIFETCFGESPDFGVDYRMTYDNQDLLSDFRSALINYDKSNSCNPERLGSGS